MASPREGLAALRAAAEDGSLENLCRRLNIELLTVFGSVLDPEREPRDLDLAVYFSRDAKPNILAVMNDFINFTDVESLDIMHLNRAGVVARDQALTLGEPLYEAEPSLFANQQMAAAVRRADTAWFRKLGLKLLAEGRAA